jgi:predicted RND superfamily exporter protein
VTNDSSHSGIAGFLERRSGTILLAFAAITLLLLIPLIALDNDDQYAGEPAGEVFDLRSVVNDRFAASTHGAPFLVEATGGDILTQAPLWELYRNEQALREADGRGELHPDGLPPQPYLFAGFNTEASRSFVGTYTIADAVQDILINDPRLSASLETASDAQVKIAVHELFANPQTAGFRNSLSIDETSERRVVEGREISYWTASSSFFVLLADNDKLGGGTFETTPGADDTTLDKEEFNRDVQELLRGDEESIRVWGIGLDATLEAIDEAQRAGIFIMLTVIAALIVVGISLRSYWAVALTGGGLAVLMIWLKGISNLAGIEGGLIIDLIVPIAMISLGVDFAVHALRRYKEERDLGYDPGRALRIGFTGVLGALVLAMLSDSVAFLSNASSGIDAVIAFGVTASIASVSSFLVLGVVVPLAMMRIDVMRTPAAGAGSVLRRLLAFLAVVVVAVMFAATVILLVAVSVALGAAVALLSIALAIGLPALVLWRRSARESPKPVVGNEPHAFNATRSSWLVAPVVGLARARRVVLPVTAVVTGIAVFFAVQLDAAFDVKDFFDSNSDFVVGVDKVDEDLGDRGGEPGTIVIEGDLTDPGALIGLQQFLDDLLVNPSVAKGADGEIDADVTVLDLLHRLTASDFATDAVDQAAGVLITDEDGDLLPDDSRQLAAAYEFMISNGVPLDESTLVYDAGRVRETLFFDPGSGLPDSTVVRVGLPGTREQAAVTAARKALTEDLEALDANPAIALTGLTGSPFTREETLRATTRTLQTSLPLAAIGVSALLFVAMRSLRFAFITIIPIGLVAAWLYAFMHLAGFSLNFVTATIGAVSIGVGIDFSIHMTERFREELRKMPDRVQALRTATAGTGVALMASAVSSIAGFAIMGFAPMPLFASYGILTATMIFLALFASLAVLPSLLIVVTPDATQERDPT